MALTEKQRLYQSCICAAEEAGLSLAEYARQQGINVHCLYGERQRLRRRGSKSMPGFVRVEDVSGPVMSPTLMQIRLPNGVSLALPTDQLPLTQILQTLATL